VQIFTHKDKKFILINGKEFFLIQGFPEGPYARAKLIFMQVIGKVNLNYEDLPDKDWELIKTRTPKGNIFTAYRPKFFDYEALERENRKTLFVGRDKSGSLFLALYVTARILRLNYTDCQIKKVVKSYLEDGEKQIRIPPNFWAMTDEGNQGNTAYIQQGIGKGYRNVGEDEFKLMMKNRSKNGRSKS